MKILRSLGLTVLSITLSAGTSNAFKLTIGNRAYPAGIAFQAQMDALANAIENTFNTTIASANNQSNFLNAIGNANAVSGRSYLSPGVVPANEKFFANVGASAALALGSGSSLSKGVSLPSNQLPPIGVGAKTGFTLGMPGRILPAIGKLDRSRTMYTLSFYQMDLSRYIGHGVGLSSTELGAGVAYQVYNPKQWSPLIRYNGIRISTGLTYASFDADYKTPFNLTQFDPGTGSTMSFNNNVDIGVTSKVFSFSTEVTTGIRVLWVWNLYTGLGLDFNVGSSSITGGSSGPVSAVLGGTTYFTGTGTVSGGSESAAPTFAMGRFLVGTEVDLGAFGIYLQGQASTPSVYGLNFGAHILF